MRTFLAGFLESEVVSGEGSIEGLSLGRLWTEASGRTGPLKRGVPKGFRNPYN